MSVNQLLFEVVYQFQITAKELRHLDFFKGSGQVYDKLEQSYKYFSSRYLGKEQILFMQFIKLLEKFLNQYNQKNQSSFRSKSDQKSQQSATFFKFILVNSSQQKFLSFLNDYSVYDFFLIQAYDQKTAIEYFENYLQNQLHLQKQKIHFISHNDNKQNNQIKFLFCHLENLEQFEKISEKFKIFECQNFESKNDNSHMVLNIMFKSIFDHIKQYKDNQGIEEIIQYRKRQVSLSNPQEYKQISSQLLDEEEKEQLQQSSRIMNNRLAEFSKDLDSILQKYSIGQEIKNQYNNQLILMFILYMFFEKYIFKYFQFKYF